MLEIEEIHDCQPPDMVADKHTATWTTGWWLFKKEHSRVEITYISDSARWVCPSCNSKWGWSMSSYQEGLGHWMCLNRVSVWTEIK